MIAVLLLTLPALLAYYAALAGATDWRLPVAVTALELLGLAVYSLLQAALG